MVLPAETNRGFRFGRARAVRHGGFDGPDHLPPAVLTPALQHTVVDLADCP